MQQSEWNERQRRHWAASEALALGYGGISAVARATGLSRPTIRKGIAELKNNEQLPNHRVQRPGGGRKKTTQKQPEILSALAALVEPTAKGNPMSPLRWTTKSTRRLSRTLKEQGFVVSFRQVCRLLHELGYQLSANRKSMNWKGQPLVSMEMIINLIGNTTSQTGLKVYAMEDRNTYPTVGLRFGALTDAASGYDAGTTKLENEVAELAKTMDWVGYKFSPPNEGGDQSVPVNNLSGLVSDMAVFNFR